MIAKIFWLVMCHLIGDYVLQIDFIAHTKGDNAYNMFVHCFLYLLPFALKFGLSWRLAVLFALHFLIDETKAKMSKITYMQDQILHYCCLLIFLMY